MPITFQADDLDSLDVEYLIELHYAELRSISPPDACHVLPSVSLRNPSVTLWSARNSGALVGVGALKELASNHGEVDAHVPGGAWSGHRPRNAPPHHRRGQDARLHAAQP
jgi:hypothetical protein